MAFGIMWTVLLYFCTFTIVNDFVKCAFRGSQLMHSSLSLSFSLFKSIVGLPRFIHSHGRVRKILSLGKYWNKIINRRSTNIRFSIKEIEREDFNDDEAAWPATLKPVVCYFLFKSINVQRSFRLSFHTHTRSRWVHTLINEPNRFMEILLPCYTRHTKTQFRMLFAYWFKKFLNKCFANSLVSRFSHCQKWEKFLWEFSLCRHTITRKKNNLKMVK